MATPKQPGSPGRGGKREGAGRTAGSKNALPLGAVKAMRAANLRVPKDANAAAVDLADEALATIVQVMRKPMRGAGYQLQAATAIRDEICGPVAKKMEHTGAAGGAVIVEIVKETGDDD